MMVGFLVGLLVFGLELSGGVRGSALSSGAPLADSQAHTARAAATHHASVRIFLQPARTREPARACCADSE
jgi:hypothetical protein